MKKYLLPLLALSFSAIHCTKENEKIVVQEKVTQGSMILSGRGIPSAEKGQTGDYYLDLSSSELYGPKTKDGWGNSVLNLKGLKGDKGDNGTNGQDGQPGRDGQNGQPGRDGQNGETPRIGDNGNWWIGNQDTGKPARGEQGTPGSNGRDGQNGFTPYIGPNGNWWVDNHDTGKPARGAQGPQGPQGNAGHDGQPGADGSKILAENRAPQASDGAIGDYFIDKAAKIFYGPKTASGWPTTGISLTGNPVVTEDYQLSPDGKTLVKWLNGKTRYIDMNTDPKLSEVEKIANNAFDDINVDYDLSTIIVGDKVTELGNFTFSKCTRLRRIELPDGLTTIGKGAFDACSNLQYINIPETVTNLGEQAFTNCTKLKTITIPKGISSFGKRTFLGCTALQTLILENPTAFEIDKSGMQVFRQVTLKSIYVPYGSTASYKALNTAYQSKIKSVVIE